MSTRTFTTSLLPFTTCVADQLGRPLFIRGKVQAATRDISCVIVTHVETLTVHRQIIASNKRLNMQLSHSKLHEIERRVRFLPDFRPFINMSSEEKSERALIKTLTSRINTLISCYYQLNFFLKICIFIFVIKEFFRLSSRFIVGFVVA